MHPAAEGRVAGAATRMAIVEVAALCLAEVEAAAMEAVSMEAATMVVVCKQAGSEEGTEVVAEQVEAQGEVAR